MLSVTGEDANAMCERSVRVRDRESDAATERVDRELRQRLEAPQWQLQLRRSGMWVEWWKQRSVIDVEYVVQPTTRK